MAPPAAEEDLDVELPGAALEPRQESSQAGKAASGWPSITTLTCSGVSWPNGTSTGMPSAGGRGAAVPGAGSGRPESTRVRSPRRGSTAKGPGRSARGPARCPSRIPRRRGQAPSGLLNRNRFDLGLEMIGPALAASPAANEGPRCRTRRATGIGPVRPRMPSRSNRACAGVSPCRGPDGPRSHRRPGRRRSGEQRQAVSRSTRSCPSIRARVKPSSSSERKIAAVSDPGRISRGKPIS